MNSCICRWKVYFLEKEWTVNCTFLNKRPKGLKPLTRETCLICSFAQNYINYMPIIWISNAKLIVFFNDLKKGWNKCDPRGALHILIYIFCHWCDPCQTVLYLFIRRRLKILLFDPFLGAGPFVTSFEQT